MCGLVLKGHISVALPEMPRNVKVHKLVAPNGPVVWALAADAELLYKLQVTLAVTLGNVAQQTAALTNHLQQAAAGHVVVLVLLKVLGKLLNSLGKHGDLYAGTTGVSLMDLRAPNSGGLLFSSNHCLYFNRYVPL